MSHRTYVVPNTSSPPDKPKAPPVPRTAHVMDTAQAQSEEERAGLQAQLELTSQGMERAQQRLWALEHTPAPQAAPVWTPNPHSSTPDQISAWPNAGRAKAVTMRL